MIAFCHLLNDASGSPVILREAIRALSKTDPDRLLFVGSQGRGVLEGAGVPIHRYWYRRSRFRLLTLFTYAASQVALYRALSRARVPADALIYVNTLLPFGAALWGARNRRTVIYHAHEVSISPGPLRWFLVRVAEKTARHVFYVSDDHRARLPIAGVHTAVLPNPVASAIAETGSATPYEPRRSGRFNVLMLASPRDFKGVPEFLDLARRFEARSDVRFTLVLNGGAAEIAQYLPPERVPGNVTVHPRTDDPARFYATADVLLNLSRVDQWIETFGLTIAEAMAFGLPVIVPPVGGPSELVDEGTEGYLVDSRDADKLERRLTGLIDTPETALAMSAAARRRAQTFTVERFSATLQARIDAVTSDPNPEEDRQ